jgi:hypothetical protein
LPDRAGLAGGLQRRRSSSQARPRRSPGAKHTTTRRLRIHRPPHAERRRSPAHRSLAISRCGDLLRAPSRLVRVDRGPECRHRPARRHRELGLDERVPRHTQVRLHAARRMGRPAMGERHRRGRAHLPHGLRRCGWPGRDQSVGHRCHRGTWHRIPRSACRPGGSPRPAPGVHDELPHGCGRSMARL